MQQDTCDCSTSRRHSLCWCLCCRNQRKLQVLYSSMRSRRCAAAVTMAGVASQLCACPLPVHCSIHPLSTLHWLPTRRAAGTLPQLRPACLAQAKAACGAMDCQDAAGGPPAGVAGPCTRQAAAGVAAAAASARAGSAGVAGHVAVEVVASCMRMSAGAAAAVAGGVAAGQLATQHWCAAHGWQRPLRSSCCARCAARRTHVRRRCTRRRR